jgi:hypothetical protein
MHRKLIASALTTLAIAGPALAVDDNKNHPGLACLPAFPTYVYERWQSRVENSWTATQVWHCPFVTDSPGHSFTGIVTVVDLSSSATVSCTVQTRTSDAQFVTGSSRASVGGFGTSPQTLTFSRLLGMHHSYIWCSLPPPDIGRSSLVSYEIDED